MKRRIMPVLALVLMILGGVSVVRPVAAATPCVPKMQFLGFKTWYDGLKCENVEGSQTIVSPAKDDEGSELTSFIWLIALNVLFDICLVIGYLAVGFVIYGGYLYIMSQGDPGRAAKGKKTLTSAIVGLIISMSASVIVNTGKVILGINGAGWKQYADDGFQQAQITNIFTWAYSVAGIVAVAFIVYGGIQYLLSQGDPGRTRKATLTIIYAVAGLLVVLLAAAITLFVTGTVGGDL